MTPSHPRSTPSRPLEESVEEERVRNPKHPPQSGNDAMNVEVNIKERNIFVFVYVVVTTKKIKAHLAISLI